jgi:hypothetical protein
MSPNLSPYAPPRAPIASTGTVDAKKSEPLPLVCLKCGSTHQTTQLPKTLVVIARARVVTLIVALMGAVTVALLPASNLRAVVFFGMAVVALLVRRFVYSRVDLDVPLCEACAHRWESGVLWSKILRASIFVLVLGSTVTALGGYSPLLTIAFGFAVIGGVVALALLRMRTRIVVAQKVAGDVVTLALVHPDAVAAIRNARA